MRSQGGGAPRKTQSHLSDLTRVDRAASPSESGRVTSTGHRFWRPTRANPRRTLRPLRTARLDQDTVRPGHPQAQLPTPPGPVLPGTSEGLLSVRGEACVKPHRPLITARRNLNTRYPPSPSGHADMSRGHDRERAVRRRLRRRRLVRLPRSRLPWRRRPCRAQRRTAQPHHRSEVDAPRAVPWIRAIRPPGNPARRSDRRRGSMVGVVAAAG